MQNSHPLADFSRSAFENTCIYTDIFALLNQNIISPINLNGTLTHYSRKRYAINNNLSKSSLDLGKFNNSKLSTFYESTYQQDQRGSIICLASFDTNKANQLSVSQQAIKLFKKYQTKSITFLANMGKKGSGKSFWYDKILNLSQVEGPQYSKIRQIPGLYIWSVPFVKNNLRIFMIDWIGFSEEDNLSKQDQKLLDLQTLLSEVLIVVPNWQDKKSRISDAVYANLNSSMTRLTENGSKANKETQFWPHSMYCLYRSTRAVSKETDKLAYLFKNYSYCLVQDALNSNVKQKVTQISLMQSSLLKDESSSNILNERYVKRTSLVFQDIYEKLKGKKYQSLPFTGQTLPYILKHCSKNLNSSRTLKVDKIFQEIKTEIYEKKFESAKFIYDLNLNPLKKIDRNSQNSKKIRKDRKSSKRNLQSSRMTDSIKNIQSEDQLINIEEGTSLTQKNPMETSLKYVFDLNTKKNLETSLGNNFDQSLKMNNPQKLDQMKLQPSSLDEIIQIFRKTNENVLKDFNKTNYDQKMHQKYELKILQYGEVKEKQVLKSNKVQTFQKLNETLPFFNHPQNQQDLQPQTLLAYLSKLKSINAHLNHDRVDSIAPRLKDIGSYAKKYDFFHVWQTEAYYKQRKLLMGLQDKKKELNRLKFNLQGVVVTNNRKDVIAQEIIEQLNKSTDKIQKTKDELHLSQKINKNQITDQDYLKQLKAHEKILQQIFVKNQKILKQIGTDPSFALIPTITLLEQKLDDKKTAQLQIQAGISNLIQSRLNNSYSLLNARKTQIRKVNGSQIRKSHLNKSMTK